MTEMRKPKQIVRGKEKRGKNCNYVMFAEPRGYVGSDGF